MGFQSHRNERSCTSCSTQAYVHIQIYSARKRSERPRTYILTGYRRGTQLTLVVAKAFVFEKYLQNVQRYRITHLT